MTRTEMVLETLVYLPFKHLTQLPAQDYFTEFYTLCLQTLRYLNFEILWAVIERIQDDPLIPTCITIPLRCVQTLKVKSTHSFFFFTNELCTCCVGSWRKRALVFVEMVTGRPWRYSGYGEVFKHTVQESDLGCQVTLHYSWTGSL